MNWERVRERSKGKAEKGKEAHCGEQEEKFKEKTAVGR